MLKNYLKTALRNLQKQKLISFINILGLSIAIGCCITSYVFLDTAFGQDKFHTKRDRVYLVTQKLERGGSMQQRGTSPAPIGPMLQEDYPQIQGMTRIIFESGTMKYNDYVFGEAVSFVDDDFFSMFDFELEKGNTDNFESGSNIVISRRIADKYFGDDDPIGKQVTVAFGNTKVSFTVGGVFKPFPRTASFFLNIAAPITYIKQANPEMDLDDWRMTISSTFLELDEAGSFPTIQSGMEKYVGIQNEADKEWEVQEFPLEVLETLSVRSEYISGDISGGSDFAGNLVIFLLGTFMLLLACFNYINTSIASGARRLKEIGIRKVVGGIKRQLVFQFITENMVLTFIALLLGILWAAVFFIPGFESIFSVGLKLEFTTLRIWLFFILITVITGLASGAYPAFYIASFKPLDIFRGRQKMRKNRFIKTFLTFQFILALLLISGGFVFTLNSRYQAERDWGYNHEHVIVVPLINGDNYVPYRNAVAQIPNIELLGGNSNHMGRNTPLVVIDVAGEKKQSRVLSMGDNYQEIMKFRLKQGRFLDPRSTEDQENYVLVNETFLNDLEVDDPMNFTFRYDSNLYRVAGVVEDFHSWSFYNKIEPMMLSVVPEEDYNYLSLRVTAGRSNQVMESLRSEWRELFPDLPFTGFYQDDVWGWYFENIAGHGKLMRAISALSIILSCIGLFGLVSINVTFRIKEFSIRKVLGANPLNLAKVMNKQFLILLVISTAIGLPISWYLIKLLMDAVYEYHMPLTFWPYLLGTIILFLTSLLTISSLIFKVVKNNPAETLRAE